MRATHITTTPITPATRPADELARPTPQQQHFSLFQHESHSAFNVAIKVEEARWPSWLWREVKVLNT